MYGLVKEWSEAPLCLCAESGCIYNFCGGDIFVMQMMFFVKVVNTKVVDNFCILLFLKFYDFRPDGLGVKKFTSFLSAFPCPLNRSEWFYCLDYLNMESCICDNRIVVVILLIFPKCPRTPFLVVYNSCYSCSNWNNKCLSKSGLRWLLGVV